MLKKTSDALKKCIVFFIKFSSIFREKSVKNRAKSLKNGIAHKNRQKSRLGTLFFSKKSIFGRFLGFVWVPGGLPGRPGTSREPPRIVRFFINFQFRLKTGLDGPLGGPREAPRVPRASPGYHFGSIFAQCCMSKNIEKISENVTET